jgi:hypothetical protein
MEMRINRNGTEKTKGRKSEERNVYPAKIASFVNGKMRKQRFG